MKDQKAFNTDLILRERLALQRTALANQATFLAFLRTALYFLIAGLSVQNVLKIDNSGLIAIALLLLSLLILVLGIANFIIHKKAVLENKKHIGAYQLDYFESK